MSKSTTSYANHFRSLKLLMVATICLLGLLAIISLFSPARPAHAFPDEFNANLTQSSIPARQTTNLSVEILSAPYAIVAGSSPSTGPRLFVVHARVTNTGSETADNVLVTLEDYADQSGWTLANGEDPERFIKTLGSNETYNAYWLATYPLTEGQSNPYTVTAVADNASQASDSATVATDKANRVGNSNLSQTELNVQVGFEFTLAAGFELGNNIEEAILIPAGNLDFDAGAYRLVATEARVYRMDTNATVVNMTDLVYTDDSAIRNLPNNVDVGVDVTFTFLALAPSNTQICPVAASFDGSNLKFDKAYCTDASQLAVDGKLTIEMSKTSSAPEGKIEQGDVMTYTITYKNIFTKAVEGVWIWDEIPDNVTVDENSITPAKATESNEDMIVWNIGSVDALSSGQIKFRVDVNGAGSTLADGTPIVNNAFLSINPERFTAQSILTAPVTTTIKAPNIALSKTDNQDTANPGEVFNYIISLPNDGGVAAQGLVVTDTLPTGDLISLAGAPDPLYSSKDGQTMVWDAEALVNKNAITIPVALKANVPTTQNLINTVEATYQNSFGFEAEKTAQDTTQATAGTAELAEIEVSKTATPQDEDLNVGELVTYTITITNVDAANETANVVSVIDDLPDGVICQSVSATVNDPGGCADPVIWTIDALPAGETVSLEIVVLLGPATEGENVINTIEVTGPNIEDIPPGEEQVCADGSIPDPNCDSTPQEPNDATVSVSKTARDLNGGDLEVGDTLRYTIEVANTDAENDPAFDLVVTDDLSEHVLCVSVSGSTSPPSACANPLIWEIELLAGGQTVTLTIDVLIKPSGADKDIINSVTLEGANLEVDSNTDDKVCPDNSDPPCNTDPTVGEVSVAVTKTSEDLNGGDLEIGDTLRYTIQATNQGNPNTPDAAAFDIQIIDTLPDQVTCKAISADKNQPEGCADVITWNISRLDPGETATLTINVTIDQNAAGQSIINSLSVDGANIADVTPPAVCPDGKQPKGGACTTTPIDPNAPEEGPPTLYLPVLFKQ